MSWDRPGQLQLQLRSGGVSPERIGISGVLWSTLWWCVCVQLGKVHGHSSLFRLQQPGCKGQQGWAKTWMRTRSHRKPSTRANHTVQPVASDQLWAQVLPSTRFLQAHSELQPHGNAETLQTPADPSRLSPPDTEPADPAAPAQPRQAPNELLDGPFTNNTTQSLSATELADLFLHVGSGCRRRQDEWLVSSAQINTAGTGSSRRG